MEKSNLMRLAWLLAIAAGCGERLTPQRLSLLTPAELGALDQKVESTTLSSIREFSKSALIAVRPLPPSAMEELRRLVEAAPKPYEREEAAGILVLHQRDSATNLAAIEKAMAKEKDARAKEFFARAVEHLKVPLPPLAILADGNELSRLIESGLQKAAAREGRTVSTSSFGALGFGVQGSISPVPEDLPETITATVASRTSRLTLGWAWTLKFHDAQPQTVGNQMVYKTSDRTLEPAPIGALVRIDEPLRLSKSTIASDTFLYQTTYGWSVVKAEDLLPTLKAQVTIKAPLQKYGLPDASEIATTGAALLGSRGKALVPVLTDTNDRDRFMLRAVALSRIGDKTALPVLREWRQKSESWPGIVITLDKAIAALEKK